MNWGRTKGSVSDNSPPKIKEKDGRMAKPKFEDPENSYVPQDYKDLYLYYIKGREGKRSLCQILIRSFIPYMEEDERESLSQEVFLRCMEKKVIEKYDPSRANFGGVIFFVTRSVCVNYLSRRQRNPLTGLCAGSLSQGARRPEEFEPGVYFLDEIFEQKTKDQETKMDAQHLVKELFNYARTRFKNPQNKRDESLLLLLKMLLEEYDPQECAPILGVTPSTVYNWIAHLKMVARGMREAKT